MSVLTFFSTSLFAQEKKMSYDIISKGDKIGQMQIKQRVADDDLFFSLLSNVETRLLMNIRVTVQEEAHYHKGKLMLSSSKRFVNDKLKGNKETKAAGDHYLLTGAKEEKLDQKEINYSFPMLYFKEPVSVVHIYSDYYQKNLLIQAKIKHTYTIALPEGGSNTYYYSNGICNKVDIHNALFSAQMVLNE